MDCFELPFTRGRVGKAGEFLRSSDWSDLAKTQQEFDILSIWRAAHAGHLANFNSYIRAKLNREGYHNAIIAQRLKRWPSILDKLERFPKMSLERMQDIAGIRVVLENIHEVIDFQKKVISHKTRKRTKVNDYILEPKSDGYRGIHSVFKCYNAACPELDGLCVELQVRSKLQHRWATAVETLGILTNSSIKTGRGAKKHEEYFKLVSALFSYEEHSEVIAEFREWERSAIIERLKQVEEETHATATLEGAAVSALKIIASTQDKAAYHLIELNTELSTVSIMPFAAEQLAHAERLYKIREQETRIMPQISVVLVAVGNVKEVKKAYPNFFLDANIFIRKVRRYLAE